MSVVKFANMGDWIVYLLRIKVGLICCVPFAAYAAEQTMRNLSAENLSALTWSFIFGFAMLGWAVADLDKVAELWKSDGTDYDKWKRRFSLAKGIAASNTAGVLMFFLGKLSPGVALSMLGVDAPSKEMPEMLLLIFTTGAGYMGTRWFDWLEKRITK